MALALAFAGLPVLAAALQVATLEVSRNLSVYHLVVEALIDAPPKRMRELLLDE